MYVNAPAGLIFPGDSQYTVGNAPHASSYATFVPRVGLAWDPKGDGRMTIRAAYGMFTDRRPFHTYTIFTQSAPWGNNVQLSNVRLSNPWGNYPGGNPFPLIVGKETPFPTFANYGTHPFDLSPSYMNQWNLSIQRQLGADLLLTANYVGNNMIHLPAGVQLNPAVFLGLNPCTINSVNYPVCSTTVNTNQRRRLYLQNPQQGQYYSGISELDNGGTGTYHGLLLAVQKRLSHGVSALVNYTWSHCISDSYDLALTGAINVDNRRALRSNCQTGDTRHVFNLSTVLQMPRFSSRELRLIASDWQLSPIIQARSAQFFSVTQGVDTALTGQATQTPNQVMANPYPKEQTINNWISRSAFATPLLGTYGNMGLFNMKGPNVFQFDLALSRTFPIAEAKTLQLRGEAFNVLNHANFNNPVSTLNSGSFGQIQRAGDPRIMQFAFKVVF